MLNEIKGSAVDMISPHFRYALISTLVGVKAPVACGHYCYKNRSADIHFYCSRYY